MKIICLFLLIFEFLSNIESHKFIFLPSIIDKQAKALIEELKKKGNLEALRFYIIKNGKSKASEECKIKGYGSESVCKKTIEIISRELNVQSSDLNKKIKSKGKWDDLINYIKKNGANKAIDNHYQEGYTYKEVSPNAVEFAMKGSSSISFKKEVKKDGSICLTPSSGKYNYVLIFLHGLYQTPQGIENKFNKELFSNFKIILPSAPMRETTPAGGKKLNSWYDIKRSAVDKSPIKEEEMNFKQFDESSQKIKKLITEEVKALNGDYSRIFLGGYSQGACLTFDVGLSFSYQLGGIFSFCGMPFKHTKINRKNKEKLNICVGLGSKDNYFPLKQTKNQINSLIGERKTLKIKEYKNQAHELTQTGINDMINYIKNRLI